MSTDASTELAVGCDGGAWRAVQGSDDGGNASRAPLADGLGSRLGPAVTFATTEHFNLQTARSLAVSEAKGRASRPEAVDRAAISVPPSQRADAA